LAGGERLLCVEAGALWLFHHARSAAQLILAGIAADICVLFTANDAYMRGFKLIVPRDCVASNSADVNRRPLSQMSELLKADIRPSTRLRLSKQAPADQPNAS